MHYPLCWLLVFIAPMSTIRAQSISDFAGPWKGELTQPGTTFDFDLDLRVAEGNKLTGSTRVGTKGTAFFGRMSVEAAVNGSSLFFQERKIIEQNLDPAISRWCIKSARLTLTSDRLEGIWSQPGCNEGSIRLVKKREPICGDPGIVDQMPTTSVPVAYGPHLYEVRNTICSTSSPGCSKSAVFLTMLRSRSYVAPTSNRKPVENCAETILQFPGDSYAPIKTTVTAKGGEYSATNYTLPGHLLHPGKVRRIIEENNGKVEIITVGEGSGILPKLNEVLAPAVWNEVDVRLRDAFADSVQSNSSMRKCIASGIPAVRCKELF